MSKKHKRDRRRVLESGPVFVRTIEVDFEDRTITVGGSKVRVEARCVSFPILSGDAVFMPRGLERIL